MLPPISPRQSGHVTYEIEEQRRALRKAANDTVKPSIVFGLNLERKRPGRSSLVPHVVQAPRSQAEQSMLSSLTCSNEWRLAVNSRGICVHLGKFYPDSSALARKAESAEHRPAKPP